MKQNEKQIMAIGIALCCLLAARPLLASWAIGAALAILVTAGLALLATKKLTMQSVTGAVMVIASLPLLAVAAYSAIVLEGVAATVLHEAGNSNSITLVGPAFSIVAITLALLGTIVGLVVATKSRLRLLVVAAPLAIIVVVAKMLTIAGTDVLDKAWIDALDGTWTGALIATLVLVGCYLLSTGVGKFDQLGTSGQSPQVKPITNEKRQGELISRTATGGIMRVLLGLLLCGLAFAGVATVVFGQLMVTAWSGSGNATLDWGWSAAWLAAGIALLVKTISGIRSDSFSWANTLATGATFFLTGAVAGTLLGFNVGGLTWDEVVRATIPTALVWCLSALGKDLIISGSRKCSSG